MTHILKICTDDDCSIEYTNPINGAKRTKQSYLCAEFNGSTHRKKLNNFLATLRVKSIRGKEEKARQLERYIEQLKKTTGDYAIGGNIHVSYKQLAVEFSI